jgi:hypothetical protein
MDDQFGLICIFTIARQKGYCNQFKVVFQAANGSI